MGCGVNGTVTATVFADEAARVGEDLVAGGGVKACALAVAEGHAFELGADFVGEGGAFGAPGPLDALGGWKRVDGLVVET